MRPCSASSEPTVSGSRDGPKHTCAPPPVHTPEGHDARAVRQGFGVLELPTFTWVGTPVYSHLPFCLDCQISYGQAHRGPCNFREALGRPPPQPSICTGEGSPPAALGSPGDARRRRSPPRWPRGPCQAQLGENNFFSLFVISKRSRSTSRVTQRDEVSTDKVPVTRWYSGRCRTRHLYYLQCSCTGQVQCPFPLGRFPLETSQPHSGGAFRGGHF